MKVGSRDEFMAGMWKAIRAGSVPAMRLYWEMTKGERAASPAREEPEDALAFCDELAARRAPGESRCSEPSDPDGHSEGGQPTERRGV